MLGFIQKVIDAVFGKKSDKDIQAVLPIVKNIKTAYATLQDLSHDELRGKTLEFKARIKEHLSEIDNEVAELEQNIKENPDLDAETKEEIYSTIDKLKEQRDKELEVVLADLLPEAFAVVKETARRFQENTTITSQATELDREIAVSAAYMDIQNDQAIYKNTWTAGGNTIVWNMLHYDVQLIGGIVLHQGKIAEMATGEGKTLVATLPAYLNGIAGQGVHVITVNNYLAKRDSEWMQPIFNFLGLTVSCIDLHKPNTPQRRKAYGADIVYGTNNEFGFDYLRDNMVLNPAELVQGKKHFAMIDEVDSVLIDDARTPLIISGPVEKGDEQQYDALKGRIEKLVRAQREFMKKRLLDAKRLIAAGKSGPNKDEGGFALLQAFRALPKTKSLIKYLSEPGIKNILLATENHYLQEQAKRMPEVDEELYFVIEEKNNQVNLTEKGTELITGSGEDPNFFVMPDIGGQMADIENADLSPEESLKKKEALTQDFAIKSERLHSVQQLLKAYTLFEKDVEYVVLDDKVKIVDEQTGRIMDGRRYSEGLHQAIEAKENVKIEAATQTFATVTLQNFFRMYHKLAGMTGTAETEAGEFWEIYKLDVVIIPTNRPIARDDREDLVYRTVREKFEAVIEEVVKLSKAGRPILVGTTSVEISEFLSRLLKEKHIKHNVLNAKQHAREADIVAVAGQPGTVTIATNMAGRGTDIKLGEGVKAGGGLAIIGTERHDSRRVDRQLRGRAGRQGDPGSSQFFVSLEDNLMRLFGSEKIVKVMDRMGYQEGEVIQHSMITKSIERAQKKVEENNFGTRKRLLDYDEVMNAQREGIYAKRKHALFGKRLSVDLYNTFRDLAEELVYMHHDMQDYEAFKFDVIRYFATETDIDETTFTSKKAPVLAEQLYKQVAAFYKRKLQAIVDMAMPVITNIYENRSETLERVIIPFTDGKRVLHVVVGLQMAIDTEGKAIAKELEKNVSLRSIDESWKNHLRAMDELKQSVQTAVYEQKDPLLIFKKEAFNLFSDMLVEMNKDITSFLFKASIPIQQPQEVKEAKQPAKTDLSKLKTTRTTEAEDQETKARKRVMNQAGSAERKAVAPIRRDVPKVGRNAPCPCGSGKKYKQCHGR